MFRIFIKHIYRYTAIALLTFQIIYHTHPNSNDVMEIPRCAEFGTLSQICPNPICSTQTHSALSWTLIESIQPYCIS